MKKIFIPLLAGVTIITCSAFVVVNSTGIQWWSGSPWDGGTGAAGTCANCHGGGATTPTLTVTSSPAWNGAGTQYTYMPGMTYTITVQPGGSYPVYGFNMEILNSTSSTTAADAGTFGSAVTTNTKLFVSAGNPTTASHKTPSAATSPFKFTWTAPMSGNAYLYCDVLGANNSGTDLGDKVSAVTAYTLTASPMGVNQVRHNTDMKVVPNPATDNLRISYNLSERGKVDLKLYNLNGEWVADLKSEMQDSGSQNVEARLPIGIAHGAYIVKLSVNGRETMQKLMVN